MNSWPSILLVGCVLAACATADPGPDRVARVRQLLARCTVATGFDPERPGVGERQIAPSELAWRDCAYEAIRTDIMPSSLAPTLYQNLIDADRAMTGDVAAGRLTRSERKSRLDTLFAEIVEVEKAKHRDQVERLKRERMDDLEREKQIQAIDRILRDTTRFNQTLNRGF